MAPTILVVLSFTVYFAAAPCSNLLDIYKGLPDNPRRNGSFSFQGIKAVQSLVDSQQMSTCFFFCAWHSLASLFFLNWIHLVTGCAASQGSGAQMAQITTLSVYLLSSAQAC